jgi:arsenate reductase (thioredoxin)
MTTKPIVLVLCTGNSARSQMAEAFLRKYQGDKYEVHSAGTEPRDRVHPLAVRAMAEAGIDISAARPKSTDRFLGRMPVRYLLIVCDNANQSCPRVWPGTYSRSYVPFDDPAAFVGPEDAALDEFRRVRDQIETTMKTWRPESGAGR